MTDKEFKDIILQLQPYMQAVAEKLLKDADSASDAVQEAVIDLWKQRQQLDLTKENKSLFAIVVKRRCIDFMRKHQPSFPIDEGVLMLKEPEPDEDSEELYAKARKLVDKLPRRQRKVIVMKYEVGMSNKEIEEATGMSSTHLYATFSRAYKSLRDAFIKNKI